MSENVNQQQFPTFSLPVYLPDGTKVYFTTPTYADGKEAARHMMALTADFKASGLLLSPPGLEAGEELERIGWVARRTSKEGTPLIDLYADSRLMYPWIKIYLDNDEAVATFNRVTGLDFNKIPLYEGDSHMERGKNTDKDRRYIIPVRNPVSAIKKRNPRYNPEEPELSKRKPQYLFVRFEGEEPLAQPTDSKSADNDPEPPWNTDTVKTLCGKYGKQVVWDALGIKEKASEWTQGWKAAVARIEAHAKQATF